MFRMFARSRDVFVVDRVTRRRLFGDATCETLAAKKRRRLKHVVATLGRALFGEFTGLTLFAKFMRSLDVAVAAHVCPLFGMFTGLTLFRKFVALVELFVVPHVRALVVKFTHTTPLAKDLHRNNVLVSRVVSRRRRRRLPRMVHRRTDGTETPTPGMVGLDSAAAPGSSGARRIEECRRNVVPGVGRATRLWSPHSCVPILRPSPTRRA